MDVLTPWHRSVAAGIAGATKLDGARAMGAELQQLADQIAVKNTAAPSRSVRAPQQPVFAPATSAYAACILCGCTDHASGSCYGGEL